MKEAVDNRAKRAYRQIINHYGAFLNERLNAGKFDEEKFWRMQEKLTQWYANYTPTITQ